MKENFERLIKHVVRAVMGVPERRSACSGPRKDAFQILFITSEISHFHDLPRNTISVNDVIGSVNAVLVVHPSGKDI